jgi:hypothetical protein
VCVCGRQCGRKTDVTGDRQETRGALRARPAARAARWHAFRKRSDAEWSVPRVTISAASNGQASPPVTGWRLCLSRAWRGRQILSASADGKEQGGARDAGDVDGGRGDGSRVGRVTAVAWRCRWNRGLVSLAPVEQRTAILSADAGGSEQGGVCDAGDVDGERGDCSRIGRVTAIAGSESGVAR